MTNISAYMFLVNRVSLQSNAFRLTSRDSRTRFRSKIATIQFKSTFQHDSGVCGLKEGTYSTHIMETTHYWFNKSYLEICLHMSNSATISLPQTPIVNMKHQLSVLYLLKIAISTCSCVTQISHGCNYTSRQFDWHCGMHMIDR